MKRQKMESVTYKEQKEYRRIRFSQYQMKIVVIYEKIKRKIGDNQNGMDGF